MSAGDAVGPLVRDQGRAGVEPDDPPPTTSVHVNDKMKSQAQDFFKPKPESPRGILEQPKRSEPVRGSDTPVRGIQLCTPEIGSSNEFLGSLPSPPASR